MGISEGRLPPEEASLLYRDPIPIYHSVWTALAPSSAVDLIGVRLATRTSPSCLLGRHCYSCSALDVDRDLRHAQQRGHLTDREAKAEPVAQLGHVLQ